jgi:neutral amino acid transport system ATP-binding protein
MANHQIPSLLTAIGLSKRFGAFIALENVEIRVAPGSITGLIGPNGAGKTTLFNVLSGFVKPDRGQISLADQPIEHLSPHRRVDRGLVRTFQVTRVLSRLSVLDNLLLAAPQAIGEQLWQVFCQTALLRQQQRELTTKALDLLAAIGLVDHAQKPAGSLSGGQRKLLELGRSLMTQPRLILLDEPAAGVNPVLIEQLCSHILTWNRQGLSFLIIEHNMDVVMSLCHHVWVLAEGKNLVDGTPDYVQRHPQVLDAYLGL